MKPTGIIFEWTQSQPQIALGDLSSLTVLRERKHQSTISHNRNKSSGLHLVGLGLIALALGGLTGPLTPRIRLETKYALIQAQHAWPGFKADVIAGIAEANTQLSRLTGTKQAQHASDVASSQQAVPAVFDPLKTPDGASIDPVNKEFSLVIPKIGVNAAVIPAVNPTKPGEYLAALQKGIAHSSLSYFPNEDGTVFLFSHSTNYDWFVGDLNAVFYLLKNLEENDMVVLFYKGASYTYKITGKQIVDPTAVAYLAPQGGARRLILQTCWPPGSTTQRLLIFADLIESQDQKI